MKVKCDKCKGTFFVKEMEKQERFDDTIVLIMKLECNCGNRISIEMR